MVAKDIMSKKFETVLRGYKSEEVEEFLREVSLDFSRLQKENEDLEKKLEVLADKIREYREDEDALRDAILGAQRQGNALIADSKRRAAEIIEDAEKNADDSAKKAEEFRRHLQEKGEKEIASAEKKSREIIDDANEKARRIEENMNRKTDIQKEILHRTMAEIADFKKRVLDSYKTHIEYIEKIERECTNDFINDTEKEYAETGGKLSKNNAADIDVTDDDRDTVLDKLLEEADFPIDEPDSPDTEETIIKDETSDLPDGVKINDDTIKFEIDINKGYNDETIEMKTTPFSPNFTPNFQKDRNADTSEIFFNRRKNNIRPKLRFGDNQNNE